MPEVGRLAGASIALDGSFDGELATVVGGDREQPVAIEFFMQRFEVVEGRPGSLDRVATSVVPPVLLESEAATGVGDELP